MMKSRTIRHLRAIGTGIKHLLFSNRLTCPYPDARQMVSERYRGMIRLNKDKCTSCMLCARVCPANAIKMQMDGKKMPKMDYTRCVFCGFCVDICPVRALEHTSLHDVAYFDYRENQFPPEKLADGGRDPYRVPGGVVAVRIDGRKGLIYERKTAKLETREMKKEIVTAPKGGAEP